MATTKAGRVSDYTSFSRLSIRRGEFNNFLSSLFLSLFFVLVFITLSPDKFLHWFVIPVFLCGVIIGIDALKWIKGQVSIFDPIGIIGLYGLWFFFLAPLVHVWFDYWMPFTGITPPQEWREWVGVWSLLNFVGLIAFNFTRRVPVRKQNIGSSLWVIDNRIFWPILLIGLLFTAGLQIAIYYQFGGISGYVTTYEAQAVQSFRGWGIWFALSESFPLLFFVAYALLGQKGKILRKPIFVWLVFLLFLLFKILFGGLRGSRSEVIFSLFWAVGVVHFVLRPVSKKSIYLLLLFLVVFMYFYGFYKGAGREVAALLSGTVSLTDLEQRTRRDELAVLLGDLSRTDIQAFLLYRIISVRDYEYSWGRTYIGALSLLIPRSLWPDRPATKVKEGTEAQYGAGSYVPDIFQSSKVYGLAGETMLNFTPLAIPMGFAFWGLVVRYVRHFLSTLDRRDPRLLIAPWLVLFCSVAFLIGDSDNLVFFVIKNIAPLFFIIWFGTKKIRGA